MPPPLTGRNGRQSTAADQKNAKIAQASFIQDPHRGDDGEPARVRG